MAAVKVPQLMPLEKAGPKGFVRYMFPFQLADDYKQEEVLKVLKESFEETKKRLPVLACEAVPDTESTQGASSSSNMAIGYFDADSMTRRPVWPTPGERLPITELQANFIRGGVILNWCILHIIGDGKTFQKMLEVWAEECQKAQGLTIDSPVQLGPELFDKSRVNIAAFVPTAAPPKMMSPSHRAEVFYFSPASLAQLKKDANPSLASTKSEDVKWISTNDALSALLWHTVMEVQHPLGRLEGNPLSVFNIAINGRARADPPHPTDMLGCFLEYVAISMPIRTMLMTYNLSDIAVSIRRTINKMEAGKNWTDDVVALFERVPDVNQLVATAFLDVPGNHCVKTSWIGFEMYKLRWGPMFGDIMGAVRCPNVGVINGLQVVFPALPEDSGGGLEVLIGVETDALPRLGGNELWNKYAVARRG
ncbi:uncharacterized protein PAC_05778 [Phialocephala subalpina]|uniref:Trichothecene 3-O-acetyltransferase n=1 Tax=Phialocephala subalpina TaxID=576137 RepID=A0A1L7WSZ7_9HELO|nr:uncharacterized protein PAC_05778 [Phialocephala subalpina]